MLDLTKENIDLSRLTDQALKNLRTSLYKEEIRRQEIQFEKENECPACLGFGFTGNEYDHEPCKRCKTTGKYFSRKKV